MITFAQSARFTVRFFIVCLAFSNVYAQRGPGGVSRETTGPNDSNNKLWLDAESIVSSDGAAISAWLDESLSQNVNDATQGTASIRPNYKSDPSATINGHPIVRFGSGKRLVFVSADDINNNGPYTERTTFIAFRTSSDVTTRQMLYEQGGTVRGLNIFIFNGELYMGGYDLQVDGDGTPTWGYVYTRTPIAANTVYVASHVFYGPLGATTGHIRGYLNGVAFTPIATGVGSLDTHSDPPGLGAVNSDTYNETGPIASDGAQPFLGDMAEFIAYSDTLNNAERIIVENYLSAKYFSNLVVNDRFEWQLNYGTEVIGIGQENNSVDRHNTSQGRNLFQFAGDTSNFDNSEYLLIGHDNKSAAAWTTSRAPNNGNNIRRLAREWKADHTGNLGEITFTLDANDLPALPVGFSKYGIAIDSSKGITSNFNSASTYVVELTNVSGSLYEATLTVPDSAYLCLVAIESTVSFVLPASNAFETNANFSASVTASLNFEPATTAIINFVVTNNTALLTSDYDNVAPAAGELTFPAGSRTANITFDVVGDLMPEGTEDFLLTLQNGAGSTPGLNVVGNTQHTFTIYDNDNTPKIGFEVVNSTEAENNGTVYVRVVRSGDNIPPVSCDYRLRVAGGAGTATVVDDYTFSSGTINFASGQTLDSIPIQLLTDNLDESDETTILELHNIGVGADFETGKTEHTLTITDVTPPPSVFFTLTAISNGESVGAPVIQVKLSAISTKDVSVEYEVLPASTATNGVDFTLGSPGLLTIPAGDSVNTIPLFVVSDAVAESAETVVIELLNNASLTNAVLGSDSILTYTIEDYTVFEYLGSGGVGTVNDNLFWYIADSVSAAHNTQIATLPDQSPAGIDATAAAGQRAQLQVSSNTLNGHRVLRFDGTDDFFTIPNDATINTPPSSDPATSRFIFLVFRAGSDVTSRQLLYEQGGGTRGINIYIESGQIFFNAWNNNFDNSDATTPWGGTGASAKVVSGGTVMADSAYVATLVYDFNATNQLEGFLNGTSVGAISDGSIGRLYSHGDAVALGGLSGSSLFPTAPTGSAGNFGGDIAEVVYYGNAPLHEARRRIVENYLAAKYNISINNQYYSYGATHGHEVAGIGQVNPSHLDAQGTGLVRINNPSGMEAGEFLMWGHDAEDLDSAEIGDTPFSINNRMKRVWRVDGSGDVGTVTLRMDLSNFTVNAESDLELLIDGDGTFSTGATQHTSGRSYDPGTKIVTFTNVNLDPGHFFTMSSNNFMTPLPIELLRFDATALAEEVLFSWVTLSEVNNAFFTVERSVDGRHYQPVVKVEGAGNSSERRSYEALDKAPQTGTSYYRLKQTDWNGKATYSDPVAVNFKGNSDWYLYPNPTNGSLQLRLGKAWTDYTQLRITDLSGHLLYRLEGEKKEQQELVLNLPAEWQNGVYLLRLYAPSGEISTKRFVLVR